MMFLAASRGAQARNDRRRVAVDGPLAAARTSGGLGRRFALHGHPAVVVTALPERAQP
jgi:hypothetical protein